MTIDEAIEILNASLETKIPDYDLDEISAVKLGIEALKRLQSVRSVVTLPYTALLPGETKD